MIEIPEGWQQLHWKQQVALANELFPGRGIDEAAEARGAIDHEVRRRAHEATRPVVEKPEVPAEVPTLEVYLDYDVWIGEDQRVRANPDEAVAIPRDLAIRMLKEGKARRADPLPG